MIIERRRSRRKKMRVLATIAVNGGKWFKNINEIIRKLISTLSVCSKVQHVQWTYLNSLAMVYTLIHLAHRYKVKYRLRSYKNVH